MADFNMISVTKARRHVQAGTALLVCAYDSEGKFNNARLDGAISLDMFRVQAKEIPPDKEIIFY